jgi:hypothetical protein
MRVCNSADRGKGEHVCASGTVGSERVDQVSREFDVQVRHGRRSRPSLGDIILVLDNSLGARRYPRFCCVREPSLLSFVLSTALPFISFPRYTNIVLQRLHFNITTYSGDLHDEIYTAWGQYNLASLMLSWESALLPTTTSEPSMITPGGSNI